MADPHCNETFRVCAGNFDAIFVATNDPTWVRNMANQTKLPRVSLLGDFPFVKNLDESVEVLLIEEMIMALSDMLVPSFPSSITQQVLRLRIDAHEHEWDKHLLDTYYDFRARFRRGPTNII
jgi:hypothetical protein